MYLYIDTTSKIQFGILNENYDWVDFTSIESKKSSAELHHIIYELNLKNNIDLSDIKNVFYGAGPGSYTGMRVSEGIINILDWQGFGYNSFYHFDLPKLCGHTCGAWVAKAFKGEFFIYRWDENSSDKKLYNLKELETFLSNYSGEIFSNENFSNTDFEYENQILSTFDLIKNNSCLIFGYLSDNNIRQDLFYYRPLEQEFTRAK